MDKLKEQLKQQILDETERQLATGNRISPLFFGVSKDEQVMVVSLAALFDSSDNKDKAVKLCRRLVKQHKLILTALLAETWMVSGKDVYLATPPSEHPERKEGVMLLLESANFHELTLISTVNRQLKIDTTYTVSKLETIFRFFV